MSLSESVLLLCTVFVTTGCAAWIIAAHLLWMVRSERREIREMLREVTK